MGDVLGMNEEFGILFIRTYTTPVDDQGTPIVEIGFIPILTSAFSNSVHKIYDDKIGDLEDSWDAINLWRSEHGKGVAGAFNKPIWEIEKIAWDTVKENDPGQNPDVCCISYAFPIINDHGSYSSIRLEVIER